MQNPIALTQREKLFCAHYAALGNAGEAAAMAGYRPKCAANTAARLLTKPEIGAEVARWLGRLRGKNAPDALAGLRRIAFGGGNDAVRIVLDDELTPQELAELDLFAVSEMKKRKDGGYEIKFHSRLEALRMLMDYECVNDEERAGSLLEALEKSALAIADNPEAEDDAL